MLFVFYVHHVLVVLLPTLVVVALHALVLLFCVGVNVGASHVGVAALIYLLT
jgi:hypothetical protein